MERRGSTQDVAGSTGRLLPRVCTQSALQEGHGSPGQTRIAPCELQPPLPGCSQEFTGCLRADGVVGTQPAPEEENGRT